MNDAQTVDALHRAYSEYHQALRERQHGDVVASRFVDKVADILGRGRYELDVRDPNRLCRGCGRVIDMAGLCERCAGSPCICPPGAEQPGDRPGFFPVLPDGACPRHGWAALAALACTCPPVGEVPINDGTGRFLRELARHCPVHGREGTP